MLELAGQTPARWQPGYIFSAKPQPGGSLVATACSDGVMRVWDLRSGQLHSVCSLALHEGMAAACAWDPRGHCVASVATDGNITALVQYFLLVLLALGAKQIVLFLDLPLLRSSAAVKSQ